MSPFKVTNSSTRRFTGPVDLTLPAVPKAGNASGRSSGKGGPSQVRLTLPSATATVQTASASVYTNFAHLANTPGSTSVGNNNNSDSDFVQEMNPDTRAMAAERGQNDATVDTRVDVEKSIDIDDLFGDHELSGSDGDTGSLFGDNDADAITGVQDNIAPDTITPVQNSIDNGTNTTQDAPTMDGANASLNHSVENRGNSHAVNGVSSNNDNNAGSMDIDEDALMAEFNALHDPEPAKQAGSHTTPKSPDEWLAEFEQRKEKSKDLESKYNLAKYELEKHFRQVGHMNVQMRKDITAKQNALEHQVKCAEVACKHAKGDLDEWRKANARHVNQAMVQRHERKMKEEQCKIKEERDALRAEKEKYEKLIAAVQSQVPGPSHTPQMPGENDDDLVMLFSRPLDPTAAPFVPAGSVQSGSRVVNKTNKTRKQPAPKATGTAKGRVTKPRAPRQSVAAEAAPRGKKQQAPTPVNTARPGPVTNMTQVPAVNNTIQAVHLANPPQAAEMMNTFQVHPPANAAQSPITVNTVQVPPTNTAQFAPTANTPQPAASSVPPEMNNTTVTRQNNTTACANMDSSAQPQPDLCPIVPEFVDVPGYMALVDHLNGARQTQQMAEVSFVPPSPPEDGMITPTRFGIPPWENNEAPQHMVEIITRDELLSDINQSTSAQKRKASDDDNESIEAAPSKRARSDNASGGNASVAGSSSDTSTSPSSVLDTRPVLGAHASSSAANSAPANQTTTTPFISRRVNARKRSGKKGKEDEIRTQVEAGVQSVLQIIEYEMRKYGAAMNQPLTAAVGELNTETHPISLLRQLATEDALSKKPTLPEAATKGAQSMLMQVYNEARGTRDFPGRTILGQPLFAFNRDSFKVACKAVEDVAALQQNPGGSVTRSPDAPLMSAPPIPQQAPQMPMLNSFTQQQQEFVPGNGFFGQTLGGFSGSGAPNNTANINGYSTYPNMMTGYPPSSGIDLSANGYAEIVYGHDRVNNLDNGFMNSNLNNSMLPTMIHQHSGQSFTNSLYESSSLPMSFFDSGSIPAEAPLSFTGLDSFQPSVEPTTYRGEDGFIYSTSPIINNTAIAQPPAIHAPVASVPVYPAAPATANPRIAQPVQTPAPAPVQPAPSAEKPKAKRSYKKRATAAPAPASEPSTSGSSHGEPSNAPTTRGGIINPIFGITWGPVSEDLPEIISVIDHAQAIDANEAAKGGPPQMVKPPARGHARSNSDASTVSVKTIITKPKGRSKPKSTGENKGTGNCIPKSCFTPSTGRCSFRYVAGGKWTRCETVKGNGTTKQEKEIAPFMKQLSAEGLVCPPERWSYFFLDKLEPTFHVLREYNRVLREYGQPFDGMKLFDADGQVYFKDGHIVGGDDGTATKLFNDGILGLRFWITILRELIHRRQQQLPALLPQQVVEQALQQLQLAQREIYPPPPPPPPPRTGETPIPQQQQQQVEAAAAVQHVEQQQQQQQQANNPLVLHAQIYHPQQQQQQQHQQHQQHQQQQTPAAARQSSSSSSPPVPTRYRAAAAGATGLTLPNSARFQQQPAPPRQPPTSAAVPAVETAQEYPSPAQGAQGAQGDNNNNYYMSPEEAQRAMASAMALLDMPPPAAAAAAPADEMGQQQQFQFGLGTAEEMLEGGSFFGGAGGPEFGEGGEGEDGGAALFALLQGEIGRMEEGGLEGQGMLSNNPQPLTTPRHDQLANASSQNELVQRRMGGALGGIVGGGGGGMGRRNGLFGGLFLDGEGGGGEEDRGKGEGGGGGTTCMSTTQGSNGLVFPYLRTGNGQSPNEQSQTVNGRHSGRSGSAAVASAGGRQQQNGTAQLVSAQPGAAARIGLATPVEQDVVMGDTAESAMQNSPRMPVTAAHTTIPQAAAAAINGANRADDGQDVVMLDSPRLQTANPGSAIPLTVSLSVGTAQTGSHSHQGAHNTTASWTMDGQSIPTNGTIQSSNSARSATRRGAVQTGSQSQLVSTAEVSTFPSPRMGIAQTSTHGWWWSPPRLDNSTADAAAAAATTQQVASPPPAPHPSISITHHPSDSTTSTTKALVDLLSHIARRSDNPPQLTSLLARIQQNGSPSSSSGVPVPVPSATNTPAYNNTTRTVPIITNQTGGGAARASPYPRPRPRPRPRNANAVNFAQSFPQTRTPTRVPTRTGQTYPARIGSPLRHSFYPQSRDVQENGTPTVQTQNVPVQGLLNAGNTPSSRDASQNAPQNAPSARDENETVPYGSATIGTRFGDGGYVDRGYGDQSHLFRRW
ncbi:hypothetical protein QBC46DRAFT_351428 [Diplogelasinospora grovesii]|uniref:Uncharacterized protein n=1 Tax=Diplogelasinospora grovesii TaxID=303347 RepID=A0AAN6S8C7_9PEZI|nr:hypothetical protein QBC46DRAFT_351428 [Diplogelasinospora grovesii]